MSRKYTELVARLVKIEPRAGFEIEIHETLVALKVRTARVHTMLFGGGALLGLGVSVTVGVHLHQFFAQSGFYQYLVLIFSGDGVVYALWRQLLLALIDSVPVVTAALFIASIMFLLWTSMQTVVSVRKLSLASV